MGSMCQFKYLGCVLDGSGTDGAECHKKMASKKKVVGAIGSLVNDRLCNLSA